MQARGIRSLDPAPDARPRELEQRELRHAEHDEAHRRRVQVHEHVDGVRPDDGEHGQQRECAAGDAHERAAPEPVDRSVGEVEAELLHEQPHEQEVEEPDRVDASREAA